MGKRNIVTFALMIKLDMKGMLFRALFRFKETRTQTEHSKRCKMLDLLSFLQPSLVHCQDEKAEHLMHARYFI